MRSRVPHSWRRVLIRLLVLGLPTLLLGGCLLPPEPMTTQAEEIRTLYLVIFALGAAVFVAVEAFLIYAAFRYRRRDDRLPAQHHGNIKVEFVWTVIPTVIILILFVTSMFTLGNISARSDNPVVIEVHGFQWQWTFRYENGYAVTGSPGNPPVMVVPVGEPVRVILVSTDVIHSFYVPAFLVKKDVIPFGQGQQPNELEFTVTAQGTYRGQCAEFCGLLHGDMTFTVEAMAPAAFDQWLADAGAGMTPAPSVSIPDVTIVELRADQIAFNVQELEVPAGEPFIIRFTNVESIIHNVSVYDGTESLFVGNPVTGPDATIDYLVDPLDPGEYTFICDYHPVAQMTGTLIVR